MIIKFPEAIKDLKKALSIEPSNNEAKKLLEEISNLGKKHNSNLKCEKKKGKLMQLFSPFLLILSWVIGLIFKIQFFGSFIAKLKDLLNYNLTLNFRSILETMKTKVSEKWKSIKNGWISFPNIKKIKEKLHWKETKEE